MTGAKVFQSGQISKDLRGRFWSGLENQLAILSAQVASFDVLPLNYSPFGNVLKYLSPKQRILDSQQVSPTT
jgi:hypothetical protein